MQTLWHNLRFSARTLLKSSGVTALAVLCLALGSGANLTIFGLVNAILLRPLPGIKAQDQLVLVGRTENGQGFESNSYANYRDIRAHNKVFTDVAAFRSTPVSLSNKDFSERLTGAIVSGNYFDVLGVAAASGRTFLPEEDQTPGTHPVVVLSHGLRESHFAANPAIIGSTIKLNAQDFTVIGVAAKGFRGVETGEKIELWLPIAMHMQVMPGSTNLLNGRDDNWLDLAARLKPGVNVEQAQAEMDVIAAQLRQSYPRENQTKGIKLGAHLGMSPQDRTEAFGFLALVMTVSGLVLLIACANVANLLLVRAAGRRKEIAIRLALGASRWRIVGQFLTESFLISLLGSGAGLLVALWTKDWLTNLFSQALTPEALEFSPDVRLVLFTLILSCGTTLLAGLAPAMQASKPDLIPELKDAAGMRSYGKTRLSNFFVIAQVALSLILLIGAGLFVRTLQKAYTINPGFAAENLLTLSLDLKLQGYDETRGREFYRRLTERVVALPGVNNVSLAVSRPLSWGSHSRAIFLPGQPEAPNRRPPIADLNIVKPGFFQTMSIPLLAGRDFTERDDNKSAGLVLINETMARRFWPNESAVGKRFEIGNIVGRRPVEIIGVMRDSKHRTLNEAARPMMYLSFEQEYAANMFLYVRTANDPLNLLASVRNEIQQLDRNLPIFEVKTMRRHLDDSLWPQQALAALVGILGVLALVLASAGLYGVVSYAAAERTREIGIRIALGAQTPDVIRMILKQGMRLVVLGSLIGLAAAWALTRLIKGVVFAAEASDPFFGVSATDWLTFVIAPLALGTVALIACYVPARRATKVDPMVALRYE